MGYTCVRNVWVAMDMVVRVLDIVYFNYIYF